jgi:peptide chain release factor 1
VCFFIILRRRRIFTSIVRKAEFKNSYFVKLLNYRIEYRVSCKKIDMNIENKLKQLKSRYEELTVALGDPNVYSNQRKFADMSKEHSDLKEVIDVYDLWSKVRDDLQGNKEILETESDRELIAMAREEMQELEEKADRLEESIKLMLVPTDPEDKRNAIIEIRAGTGGDEAGIFAGDLFNMYRRYADSQRWTVEILNISEATKGGFKEVVFSLAGQEIFGKMKYESGVHRVQRVPETESQGRVHTSAATVAVLPEAEEVDIQINPADLEFDTFRATGAGGQHINKTDSAIRIRHLPTGTVVECQEERSQIKNREKAMVMLRTRLYEAEYEKRVKERAAERKSQVSTGDRSAKIRTYNFPQGRLTDHRIGLTLYNLDDIMKGNIEEVIKALQLQDNLERLSELAAN